MDSDKFINIARAIVVEHIQGSEGNYLRKKFIEENTYVVWLSKTLQNNKAMIGTTLKDDVYYEVTHNGDKEEIYLDSYRKEHNEVYDISNIDKEEGDV